MEDKTKMLWYSTNMNCHLCSKQWYAVHYCETKKLECPRCNNMIEV